MKRLLKTLNQSQYRTALRSLPLWAALSFAAPALAEQVVVVTADHITQRDTSDLATVQDSVGYVLPAGFGSIGAARDPDDGRFYLLARNAQSGNCQVYFADIQQADPKTNNDTAPLTPAGVSVACLATAGGLAFIQSAPKMPDAGWLIANGGTLLSYDPQMQRYDTFTVHNSDGTSGSNLTALALREEDGKQVQKLIDLRTPSSAVLADFAANGNDQSITVSNPLSIQGAGLSPPMSLDISSVTGRLYFLTGGSLYELNSSSGAATELGRTPDGTVAVFTTVAGDGGTVSDSRTYGSGGGNTVTLETNKGKITEISAAEQPAQPAAGFDYPYGFTKFRIEGLTPGDTVSITLRGNGKVKPDAYVKCMSADSCKTYTQTSFAAGVATITLVDGGAGDSDGVANGVIVDPGALAVTQATTSPTPSLTPNGGGALGLPTLLLLAGGLLRRRYRQLFHR